MPIYEYECLEQGHHFEVLQKISDKPLKKCKFCESDVKRLISSSTFVLKGGGWYAQDYTKGKPSKGPETAKSPKPTPKAPPETKPSSAPPKPSNSKPKKKSE